MTVRSLAAGLGRLVGRSLFPLCALAVVAGSAVWGPWVSLLLAYSLWRLVARVG